MGCVEGGEGMWWCFALFLLPDWQWCGEKVFVGRRCLWQVCTIGVRKLDQAVW